MTKHTDPKTNGTLTFNWTTDIYGAGTLVASAVVDHNADGPVLAKEYGRVAGPSHFGTFRTHVDGVGEADYQTAAEARSSVETSCRERLQAAAKHAHAANEAFWAAINND